MEELQLKPFYFHEFNYQKEDLQLFHYQEFKYKMEDLQLKPFCYQEFKYQMEDLQRTAGTNVNELKVRIRKLT